MSEAETLNLPTPSPISLVFASRITPEDQSFAVLFPFNRCGLIVSIRWLSCYIFCFHSSSWSRRCEAQWGGATRRTAGVPCLYLVLVFHWHKPRLVVDFPCCKEPEKKRKQHTERKEWIAYAKAVCTLHDSSSFHFYSASETHIFI